MPRKGENIYKRKDGRWEGRYVKDRNNKRAIYGYVYAKSYSEVKRQLVLKRAECAREENRMLSSAIKDESFSNVSELWLQSIRQNIKESTWIKYRNTLNYYIIPQIGSQIISTIDYATVSELCIQLMESGGKTENRLANKTVADTLSVIKSVIKYAARMKYSPDRTVLDVSVKLKNTPLRVLTVQEEQALISHLTKDMDYTRLGILICLFTGIRIGELCALTWEDISYENNSIHIHQTMQRIQTPEGPNKTKILIAEPKSLCSIRDIPLPKTLREFLEMYKNAKGYILTGKKNCFIEPRTMQNRCKAIFKECGIEDAHFHTLRHTFATRCIEVGFDVKSLSEILGHANVNITLNRYVHPSMDLKQKNMDRLSDLFAVR